MFIKDKQVIAGLTLLFFLGGYFIWLCRLYCQLIDCHPILFRENDSTDEKNYIL